MGREYLIAQAQQLKSRIKVPIGLLQSSMEVQEIARLLRVQFPSKIRNFIENQGDDFFSKVVSGSSSLNLHYLPEPKAVWEGEALLVELTIQAITVAVAELIWSEMQSPPQELAAESRPGLNGYSEKETAS